MKQWLKKYWWFPLCILFSISLPIFVNAAFLLLHLDTSADLNNATWLGFWGSYLGGLLGSVAALIALFLTIRQQDRYHSDEIESDRLSHLPVITHTFLPLSVNKQNIFDCIIITKNEEISSYLIRDNKAVQELLNQHRDGKIILCGKIQNAGVGPAFEVTISINSLKTESGYTAPIGSLGIGDSIHFFELIPENWDYKMFFSFKDVFNNVYFQTASFGYDEKDKTYTYSSISPPKLQKND